MTPRVRPPRRAPRRATAAFPLLLAALAACGGGRDDAAAADALSRDLTLASSVATPPADSLVLADTAVAESPVPPPAPPTAAAPEPAPAPAPARRPARRAEPPRPTVASAPAPAPAAAPEPATAERTPAEPPVAAPAEAPGAGRGRVAAAGTALALTTSSRVCSASMRPGDRLVATLSEPVSGPDGLLLGTGTAIVLELASITPGPGPNEARVEFLARGVSHGGTFLPIVADVPPITGTADRQAVAKPAGEDRGKVVRGAIAGAILGRILGGGAKGTVIGAAAGAAVGTAQAASATQHEVCLPAQTAVRARLLQPLAVPPG